MTNRNDRPVKTKTVPLRYAVAVPRMSIEGIHYWLVMARFSSYSDACTFIQHMTLVNMRILDMV